MLPNVDPGGGAQLVLLPLSQGRPLSQAPPWEASVSQSQAPTAGPTGEGARSPGPGVAPASPLADSPGCPAASRSPLPSRPQRLLTGPCNTWGLFLHNHLLVPKVSLNYSSKLPALFAPLASGHDPLFSSSEARPLHPLPGSPPAPPPCVGSRSKRLWGPSRSKCPAPSCPWEQLLSDPDSCASGAQTPHTASEVWGSGAHSALTPRAASPPSFLGAAPAAP